MGALSPAAWQDVGTVAVVLAFAAALLLSLVRGWVVFGPAHRELLRVKDEALDDLRGREGELTRIIETQATTIQKQTVAGEVSIHLLEALREAAGGGDRR